MLRRFNDVWFTFINLLVMPCQLAANSRCQSKFDKNSHIFEKKGVSLWQIHPFLYISLVIGVTFDNVWILVFSFDCFGSITAVIFIFRVTLENNIYKMERKLRFTSTYGRLFSKEFFQRLISHVSIFQLFQMINHWTYHINVSNFVPLANAVY